MSVTLTKTTGFLAGLLSSYLIPLVPYAMIFYGLYLVEPWIGYLVTGLLFWLAAMAESYWSARRDSA